jgi:putative Mg2+ transporter-C (MgtC) family protein
MRSVRRLRCHVADLAWWEIVIRISVAAVLGGAVGIERELREREAGFRTHLLVSVGAALFTLVSAYAWRDFSFGDGVTYDPTRIAAQIVSGIGFLGAGAIIRQGLTVRGLTTAATLWVVAAIGMASGAGYYTAAVIATLAVLVGLYPLRLVARRFLDRPHERPLSVELRSGHRAGPVLMALEDLGVDVVSFAMSEAEGRRRLDLVVALPHGARPEELVVRLGELDEVSSIRWTS